MSSSQQPPLSSPSRDAWEAALRACERRDLRVVALNDLAALDALDTLQHSVSQGSEPDRRIEALVQEWVRSRAFTWLEVMANNVGAALQPATYGSSENSSNTASQQVYEALHTLCSHVVNAAVLWRDPARAPDPPRWSFLVQVESDTRSAPSIVRLYPPALESDLEAVALEAPFVLPKSFQTFCRLTNGLDLDARGRTSINGVGPSRADWDAVTRRDWRQCQNQHELMAQWLAFQLMYEDIFAYEASQEVQTLAKRESHRRSQLQAQRLAPLMMTTGGDFWCFDVAPDASVTEHPVVYWDHETRNLNPSLARQAFGEWFVACMNGTLWPSS